MFVVPWGFFYIKLQIFSVPFVVRTTVILFICVNKKQTVLQNEFYAVLFGGYVSSSSTNVQVCQPVCEKRTNYRNIRLKIKKVGSIEAVKYIEADIRSTCCRLAS